MSILIKGMEMPKSCEFCPCMCEVDTVYQTACGCKLTMKIREIDNDTRPDWCPLVPVPKHGRLIDADALKGILQSNADLFRGSTLLNDKIRRDEALSSVAEVLNAPTIIEAEEEMK